MATPERSPDRTPRLRGKRDSRRVQCRNPAEVSKSDPPSEAQSSERCYFMHSLRYLHRLLATAMPIALLASALAGGVALAHGHSDGNHGHLPKKVVLVGRIMWPNGKPAAGSLIQVGRYFARGSSKGFYE